MSHIKNTQLIWRRISLIGWHQNQYKFRTWPFTNMPIPKVSSKFDRLFSRKCLTTKHYLHTRVRAHDYENAIFRITTELMIHHHNSVAYLKHVTSFHNTKFDDRKNLETLAGGRIFFELYTYILAWTFAQVLPARIEISSFLIGALIRRRTELSHISTIGAWHVARTVSRSPRASCLRRCV